MTTYIKQVYKGYSFTYTIKKEKYWDKVVTKSISADTVDNVTLEPYDGVTIAYNAPVVNISDGQLPDGITFDAFVGYPNGEYGSNYLVNNALIPGIALDWGVNDFGGEHTDFYYCPDDTIAMRHYDTTELPDGAVWIGELNQKFSLENVTYKANFTQVGEVTYSGNLASLAEDSSLLANKNTPTISEFFPATIDLTVRVTPTDISGYNIVFRNNIEGNYAGFRNGRFRMSSGDQGDVFMENGKTYWIRITQTPQTSSFTCTGHYMEDDGTYTIDTLPEVSDTAWTQGFSITFQFVTSNNPFYIGNAIADGSTFNGSIDLASMKMRQGTNADTLTTWWKPLGEI